MHSAPTSIHRDKLRTTVINVVFCFCFYVIREMKSDINKLICILFAHLSSIVLENFKKVTSLAYIFTMEKALVKIILAVNLYLSTFFFKFLW